MPTAAHQVHRQRLEEIRRRRLAMARSCGGLPPGQAGELWADTGYLLNALEHAERVADELGSCRPIVSGGLVTPMRR